MKKILISGLRWTVYFLVLHNLGALAFYLHNTYPGKYWDLIPTIVAAMAFERVISLAKKGKFN